MPNRTFGNWPDRPAVPSYQIGESLLCRRIWRERVAVVSGNDYCRNLKGFGLVTNLRIIKDAGLHDAHSYLHHSIVRRWHPVVNEDHFAPANRIFMYGMQTIRQM